MPVLPRLYRDRQRAELERKIAKLILEGDEVEDLAGMVLRRSADGHSWQRRRGVPVISRGVTGTAPGTDPVGELLRKETRRRGSRKTG